MLRKLNNLLPHEDIFIRWAKSCYVSDSIALKYSKVSGYGLVASKPIGSSTNLLTVPKSVWKPYSADTNVISMNETNPIFLKSIVDLSMQMMPKSPIQANNLVHSTCLALNIMNEYSTGEKSPYINMLRQSTYPIVPTTPHPLLMDQDEYLDPFLKNTSLYNDILLRRNIYNYLGNSIFRTKQSGDKKYNEEVDILVNQFKWAIGIILSRGLSGSFPFTLVPVLDFANHKSNDTSRIPIIFGHNAYHQYDSTDESFKLIANRDIQVNEEIFINYGEQRDSFSFMSVYGFLGQVNNPLDKITINIPFTLLGDDSVKVQSIVNKLKIKFPQLIVSKSELKLKYSVVPPYNYIGSELSKVCEIILKSKEGSVGSATGVTAFVKSILANQIQSLCTDKKFDNKTIKPDENDVIAVGENFMKLLEVMVNSPIVEDTVDDKSYWKFCCANIVLQELKVLISVHSLM